MENEGAVADDFSLNYFTWHNQANIFYGELYLIALLINKEFVSIVSWPKNSIKSSSCLSIPHKHHINFQSVILVLGEVGDKVSQFILGLSRIIIEVSLISIDN